MNARGQRKKVMARANGRKRKADRLTDKTDRWIIARSFEREGETERGREGHRPRR